MSVKKDMLDRVNKKAARIKELKQKSSIVETAEQYVYEYFRQVEDLYNLENNNSTIELHNRLLGILATKIRLIDPGATTNLIVPDGVRVESVMIQWSKAYLKEHPEEKSELVVGVADMLFL